MSSASFKCAFCHELTTITLSRWVRAQALRCERCCSVSSYSRRLWYAITASTKHDQSFFVDNTRPRRDDHDPP